MTGRDTCANDSNRKLTLQGLGLVSMLGKNNNFY
jgi:hypothetical protein